MRNKVITKCLELLDDINLGTYRDSSDYRYLKEVFELERISNSHRSKAWKINFNKKKK